MSRPPFDPAARALAQVVLVILALEFAMGALAKPLLRPYAYSDFVTFYGAAQAFARGDNPYDFEVLQHAGRQSFEGWVGRYLYPPPFAACAIRPLSLLPFSRARRVWVLFETGAYISALGLLGRFVCGGGWYGFVGMAALGLPFAPFRLDLTLGSVSGLLLLLITGFLAADTNRRVWLAATSLAAAIILKLSPALVPLLLLVGGDASTLRRTLVAAAALLLVALPWTGVAAYWHYARDVMPLLASGNFSWFTNQSIDAFFTRLFLDNPDTTPWLAAPLLYRVGTVSVCAGVLVALVALALRSRHAMHDPAARQWLIAATLVAGLLVARVTWEYMLVLTLPCFALWLRELAMRGCRRWRLGALSLAFAACALPIPYTQEPFRSGWWLLLESPRFYGLTLLFATTLQYRWAAMKADSPVVAHA